MPELPEVETTKRGIAPHVEGKTLTQAIIRESRLRWPIPDLSSLTQQQLHHIDRRSKYLLLNFDHDQLMIHLGMSGKLIVLNQEQAQQDLRKHDHVDLIFDDIVLRYHDPRRFGCMLLNHDGGEHRLLKALGPEPLTRQFTGNYLWQRCQQSKRPIKSVIMDSQVVVGVGNIYACESLFITQIHPSLPAEQLNLQQCQTLAKTIKIVLKKAIRAGGTTLRDFRKADGKPGYFKQQLWVYGLAGQPCQRCFSTEIANIKISNRSSFYCPTCQPKE